MADTVSQLITYLLTAAGVGVAAGWLIRALISKRRLESVDDDWQSKLDDVSRQRDRLTVEIDTHRATIEAQQAVVHSHEMAASKAQTELQSAHEKAKLLAKDLFSLRSERENTKKQLSSIQNRFNLITQQAEELQTEFLKSGDFYKAELKKSFEKRQALEAKLDNAKQEQASNINLLAAHRSEQDSVNKILSSAQIRLDNLDALEQSTIQMEAENAQFSHDATRAKQEIEALHRDVAELGELKLQNKELAECLASMENSRKQYETDAIRYREHAGDAEQHSETLRIRLDEVEQNFADMERQQRQALKDVRNEAVAKKLDQETVAQQEIDNLQEIIGVGKVFEQTLHELGIVSFGQIAAFDIADIARVNAQLKEFKGRMEQDDWIGQAKELQFKKYGGSVG